MAALNRTKKSGIRVVDLNRTKQGVQSIVVFRWLSCDRLLLVGLLSWEEKNFLLLAGMVK